MEYLYRFILVWLCLQGQALETTAQEQDPWDRLASGQHLVLIRHALAPGGGDPAGFDVNDCNTQRNLSEDGRQQARNIGDRFRQSGIETALVYSSQWCRCLETARLLNLGELTELPALNSFFQDYEKRDPQTRALRQWIETQPLEKVTVLVTHQVNISALTGVVPASGEMILLKREDNGELTLVGRISTAY